ncbi:MAG: hypothetical protein J6113_01955 [Lachnospiraceae bacterium]|nr:hypothetical protein [Lachnospiraceae bacterium]
MRFRHGFTLKEKGEAFRVYTTTLDNGTAVDARLDFFENMLRVALVRSDVPLLPTFTVCPDGNCPQEGRNKLDTAGFRTVAVKELADSGDADVCFEHCGVKIGLELMNFRLSFNNDKGLLFRDRDYISYNLEHELGSGSTHYITYENGEKVFGLGDKSGNVNKSGMSFKLDTGDAMGFDARSSDPLYKYLPFYICENKNGAYGLYYDTYSGGEADLGRALNNYYGYFKGVRFSEENLVYYVIFGSVPQIVNRFSRLMGPILFPPKWTLRYCGSTMAYTYAPDADAKLRGFIELCEKYGFKPGGFYMSSGYTQIGEKRYVFHWNTDKIPSPEGLAAYFKEHGVEFLPNIKPAFLTDHPLYDEISKHGWFLHYKDGTPALFPFWGGFGSYLDFTDPGAFEFWRDCVKRELVDKGYRYSWNDNNEYDVRSEEVYAHGFGSEVKACDIRPLFPYLMTLASVGAQDQTERTVAVSRSGIGGLQRIATTWTGDNRTSFEDFRYNHKMAMTMSLSGFYNFGQDIGGFAGPAPSKELFMRWIQYGLFTPRFTLHSWNPDQSSNMPWLYKDLIPNVKALFDLRNSFIPYLYNEMYRSVTTHDPIIYPLFLKHEGADPESDAFYFGDSVLACPVFDEGSTEVTVDLPKVDTGWYLGQELMNGTVTLPAPWDGLPVWFAKAGTLIPFEEEDRVNFRIYAKKEGSFTYEYLDDDGISLLPKEPPIIRFRVECLENKVVVRITGAKEKPKASLTDAFGRDLEIITE